MKSGCGIIDFHAHILPAADHGCSDAKESIKQLSYLARSGIEKVVATPHFYPQRHSVSQFLQRREHSSSLLLEEDISDLPKIFLGAEVLVCPGIDHMPGLSQLCIKGTNVILLEMPFTKWSEDYYETVYNISRSGLRVVMAHIDRYPEKDIERLFSECSVTSQINSECMQTHRSRKKAEKLFQNYSVSALGSDIHGTDKAAAQELESLCQRLGDYSRELYMKSADLLIGAIPLN